MIWWYYNSFYNFWSVFDHRRNTNTKTGTRYSKCLEYFCCFAYIFFSIEKVDLNLRLKGRNWIVCMDISIFNWVNRTKFIWQSLYALTTRNVMHRVNQGTECAADKLCLYCQEHFSKVVCTHKIIWSILIINMRFGWRKLRLFLQYWHDWSREGTYTLCAYNITKYLVCVCGIWW